MYLELVYSCVLLMSVVSVPIPHFHDLFYNLCLLSFFKTCQCAKCLLLFIDLFRQTVVILFCFLSPSLLISSPLSILSLFAFLFCFYFLEVEALLKCHLSFAISALNPYSLNAILLHLQVLLHCIFLWFKLSCT